MPKDIEETIATPVEGGVIVRASETGELVSVTVGERTEKRRDETVRAMDEISATRHAALERLKNR